MDRGADKSQSLAADDMIKERRPGRNLSSSVCSVVRTST